MSIFYGKQPKADGMPGVRASESVPQNVETMLLTRSSTQKMITDEDVRRGAEILAKYKAGKANLEERLVKNEEWWKTNHWKYMRDKQKAEDRGPEPASAWLFSTVMNKHADAMDNFPEPVVLPRELSDEKSARTLSAILPVILENCGYHDAYSEQWWEKLKSGTGAYGSFWDQQIDNGIGDVVVTGLDLLNLFWEPGISHIQKSRNLFITSLCDNDLLEEQYPQCKGKVKGDAVEVKKYVHDENIDTTDKSVVVDWYYRVSAPNGKKLLHYIKFVGNTLLYASENDEQYRHTGWYADGDYPVVFDVLFPEKDMPTGFGWVDILRNPQEYADRLSANILESSLMGTKKRYMVSTSTNVNPEQFRDWTEPIVEVEGEISDARVKEIVPTPPSGVYLDVLQMKIEEMKDTSSNRDVNNGSSGGGVTAAAAIAALQEAGNKTSRDMIDRAYRAQEKIYKMCIERMRQYYKETRTVRITGTDPRGYDFADFDAETIRDQKTGMDTDGNPTYRHPVFDLKVKAQKKNPFSRMEQNERAKELYGLGFFNPDRAQESLAALDMMDFEGIDKVREQVKQGQTLLNICQQMQQQIAQYQMALAAMTGAVPTSEPPTQGGGSSASGKTVATDAGSGAGTLASGVMQANTPMTSYGQRLAERSTPSVS